MQEGAGVRQMIEDELRRRGGRLRDLDVRLELGLQESVTSAVRAGFGVTFISRTSVESDLAAGTLAEARVEGLELEREILLVRASGRAETRAARAFLDVRARPARVIVRWSLAELPARARRARARAAAARRERALGDARRAARRGVVGGAVATGSRCRPRRTRCSRSAAARRSTRRRRRRRRAGLPLVSVPTTYSGAEWTPGFGVRTPDRRMVGGGGGANLAGIVYEVELTLGLPRAETVGTALNALAHCAEALYVAAGTTRPTGARWSARG